MSFGKIKAEFSVPITSFPESLHPLLKEIDGPEGNGALETDELTEVFEMYAAAKKANEEGCIALKSLPQELQKTLEVFDVDGGDVRLHLDVVRRAERAQRVANLFGARQEDVVGGRGVVGPSFTAAFLLGVVHGEKFGVVTLFRRRGDEPQTAGSKRLAEISQRGV